MISKLLNTLSKAGLNGFFFLLIGTIILAWLVPSWGVEESPLHLPKIAEYGVSLIFFFYGLKLNPKSLLSGLSNWKLHLLVQLSTFVLFPLTVIGLKAVFPVYFSTLIGLGIFYLATLPSTVSSSVVLVSIAGGNLPAAIFNASISSIIGIFITPLWMSSSLERTLGDFDITHTILKLCLEVLMPVVIGLLLHKRYGEWAARYKNALRNFDQFIILLIVFTSFCESFSGKMFAGFSMTELILLGGMMLLFFFMVFGLMDILSVWFGFNREDRITVIFCGSKKSLVQGAVMGKVMFPSQAMLGVVLLPLMLYHALQLLAGSTIAKTMGDRNNEKLKQSEMINDDY
jgi:solute carrier family 10 (sodium/bile acid cotransporter), member 7